MMGYLPKGLWVQGVGFTIGVFGLDTEYIGRIYAHIQGELRDGV